MYTTNSKVPARASARNGNRKGGRRSFLQCEKRREMKKLFKLYDYSFRCWYSFFQHQLSNFIWFQKIYYASAGPRKTHPMAGHHPWWCDIYCWPMVPVPSWKKIDGRRWGCLLLSVWWPCMGAFDQERYRKDEEDIHLDDWLLFNEQIYFVFLNNQT